MSSVRVSRIGYPSIITLRNARFVNNWGGFDFPLQAPVSYIDCHRGFNVPEMNKPTNIKIMKGTIPKKNYDFQWLDMYHDHSIRFPKDTKSFKTMQGKCINILERFQVTTHLIELALIIIRAWIFQTNKNTQIPHHILDNPLLLFASLDYPHLLENTKFINIVKGSFGNRLQRHGNYKDSWEWVSLHKQLLVLWYICNCYLNCAGLDSKYQVSNDPLFVAMIFGHSFPKWSKNGAIGPVIVHFFQSNKITADSAKYSTNCINLFSNFGALRSEFQACAQLANDSNGTMHPNDVEYSVLEMQRHSCLHREIVGRRWPLIYPDKKSNNHPGLSLKEWEMDKPKTNWKSKITENVAIVGLAGFEKVSQAVLQIISNLGKNNILLKTHFFIPKWLEKLPFIGYCQMYWLENILLQSLEQSLLIAYGVLWCVYMEKYDSEYKNFPLCHMILGLYTPEFMKCIEFLKGKGYDGQYYASTVHASMRGLLMGMALGVAQNFTNPNRTPIYYVPDWTLSLAFIFRNFRKWPQKSQIRSTTFSLYYIINYLYKPHKPWGLIFSEQGDFDCSSLSEHMNQILTHKTIYKDFQKQNGQFWNGKTLFILPSDVHCPLINQLLDRSINKRQSPPTTRQEEKEYKDDNEQQSQSQPQTRQIKQQVQESQSQQQVQQSQSQPQMQQSQSQPQTRHSQQQVQQSQSPTHHSQQQAQQSQPPTHHSQQQVQQSQSPTHHSQPPTHHSQQQVQQSQPQVQMQQSHSQPRQSTLTAQAREFNPQIQFNLSPQMQQQPQFQSSMNNFEWKPPARPVPPSSMPNDQWVTSLVQPLNEQQSNQLINGLYHVNLPPAVLNALNNNQINQPMQQHNLNNNPMNQPMNPSMIQPNLNNNNLALQQPINPSMNPSINPSINQHNLNNNNLAMQQPMNPSMQAITDTKNLNLNFLSNNGYPMSDSHSSSFSPLSVAQLQKHAQQFEQKEDTHRFHGGHHSSSKQTRKNFRQQQSFNGDFGDNDTVSDATFADIMSETTEASELSFGNFDDNASTITALEKSRDESPNQPMLFEDYLQMLNEINANRDHKHQINDEKFGDRETITLTNQQSDLETRSTITAWTNATSGIAFGNSKCLQARLQKPDTIIIAQMDYKNTHSFQQAANFDETKLPEWASGDERSYSKAMCSYLDTIWHFLQLQLPCKPPYGDLRNANKILSYKVYETDNDGVVGFAGMYNHKDELLNFLLNCDKDIIVVESGLLKQPGNSFARQWQDSQIKFSKYTEEIFPNFINNYRTFNHDLFVELGWISGIGNDDIAQYMDDGSFSQHQLYNVCKSQHPVARYVACHFAYIQLHKV